MVNSGDTAWILASTALVTLMIPGLAFFYGGMVRKKNILSTLNLSIICMALIGVQWVLVGYTLAFGDTMGGFLGNFKHLGLVGLSMTEGSEGRTIPDILFATYQLTFAMITPALITGAFVERIRFKSFVAFTLIWATLVYDPVAHWVWKPGGILFEMGALDFAGGAVVHITAGVSALAFALCIRQRQGFKEKSIEPSNIPFTVLGAGLLWAGWFGFNGGSALGANGIASIAILNSNTAAAAAGTVWMLLSWRDNNKPSVLGIVTGAVVGLVAVTPSAGFVTPLAALVIGGVAAPISYYAIRFIHHRNIDESLDVFACHGIGGIWGALATGLFASNELNPAIANGLFYGNPNQLWIQFLSIVIVGAYSFGVTYLVVKLLDKVWGLSVSSKEEQIGLDISEHRERAYS